MHEASSTAPASVKRTPIIPRATAKLPSKRSTSRQQAPSDSSETLATMRRASERTVPEVVMPLPMPHAKRPHNRTAARRVSCYARARVTAARALANDPVIEAARAAASEGLRAEIANGALVMAPAPRRSHQHAQLRLVAQLDRALRFRRGEGGPPTGWRFLLAPELHLGVGPDKLNPDIAGWRASRAPTLEEDPITTAPDWVCEVLSPSTEATDRAIKLPLFASYGVDHAWLVDPDTRVIEVYESVRGGFVRRARIDVDDAAPPFDAITIALDALWE